MKFKSNLMRGGQSPGNRSNFGGSLFTLIVVAAIIALIVFGVMGKLGFTSSSDGPSGKIKGLWTNNLGCGQPLNGESTFNLIALSSALPQNYSTANYDGFFSAGIIAKYTPDLSDGNTKYILSIGGSNATLDGWSKMLNTVLTGNGAQTFYDECIKRGLAGIDLDVELASEPTDDGKVTQWCNGLVSLMEALKEIDSDFIIQLTVLLGRPKWLGILLPSDAYDYLGIMLYNGGMYSANKQNGAGCDWDGWAELVLSNGTAGCATPMYMSREEYVAMSGIANIDPAKVICGLIVDTDPITNTRMDGNILTKMNGLVNKYGGAGSMIWLLPGWATSAEENNQLLESLGYVYDTSKCITGCPTSKSSPCTGGKTPCVSTNCGRVFQKGLTDASCAGGPNKWWPWYDSSKNVYFGYCANKGSPDT